MSTGSEDRDRTTGPVLSVFTGPGKMQQICSFDYLKHVILMKNKDSDMTSCHTSCFLREGRASLCILLVHSSGLHAFLASTEVHYVSLVQSCPQACPAETAVCRAQEQARGLSTSAAVPQRCGGGEGLDHRETTGTHTIVMVILAVQCDVTMIIKGRMYYYVRCICNNSLFPW